MNTRPRPETHDSVSGDADPLMACAICGEVLFPRVDHREVIAYLHRAEMTDVYGEVRGDDLAVTAQVKERLGHGPIDHVAIPVHHGEVRGELKCDFCSGPNPPWLLPVGEFSADGVIGSSQDWLACEVCARLLKKGRWQDVTRRAITAMSARHGISPTEPRLVQALKAAHAQVREYQSGPLRRVERDRVGASGG